MCIELVSQCDWCLFRRHVAWEECRSFRTRRYIHVKKQDFPVPTPKDCEETIKRGTGLLHAHVAVKIRLGRCPSSVCVSELLATIERKKEAVRVERRRREYHMWARAVLAQKNLWVRMNCARAPIKTPSTTSLLSLALQEQEEEEQWEDASQYDGDSSDIEVERRNGAEQATPNSLDTMGQSNEEDKADENEDE